MLHLFCHIGHTFEIPESVMGLTVFAIGGCTPEMITGVIMARRGKIFFSKEYNFFFNAIKSRPYR